jgi:hypothetical protein
MLVLDINYYFFNFILVQGKLGKWSFKSKTYDTLYDGYMFPLLVQEQLEFWPEQNLRQRTWVCRINNKQLLGFYIILFPKHY